MYRLCSSGNVVLLKCAQCVQVVDAYSMIVTGASFEPRVISPSGLGVIRSTRFRDRHPIAPPIARRTTTSPAIIKFRFLPKELPRHTNRPPRAFVSQSYDASEALPAGQFGVSDNLRR